MKMIRNILIALIMLSMSLVAEAILAQDITITDLGTLGTGSDSAAFRVNNLGQVVGVSDTASGSGGQGGFIWTAEDGMVYLGTLGGEGSHANDINDLGQVVGGSRTATSYKHSFIWTAEDGMVDLGTLGGRQSIAYGINNLGQVVGDSYLASGESHAYFWTAEDGMVDLGTLGGVYSEGSDVNDLGQVVGGSYTVSYDMHAYIWTAEGGMVDLGTLGGTYSFANDINNLGQVVGESETASGEVHPFIWTPENGMVDLGTFGGVYNYAFGVNDIGQVVGYTQIASSNDGHATLWTIQTTTSNTPAGTDVTFEATDSATGAKVTVTFAQVTEAGDTTIDFNSEGPPLPPLFKLGNPPTYFEITTTATYVGDITVCVDYNGIEYADESQLTLQKETGTVWNDITTILDTDNDTICGTTNPLSWFAVVEPNAPPIADLIVTPDFVRSIDSDFSFDSTGSYDTDGSVATCEWSFGDGSQAEYEDIVSHSYGAAGLYEVVLTVTDDIGAQTSETVLVVVYDPAAGFATGGGRFIPGSSNSDPGDMLPEIDNESPASFGFVVKYKPGATNPSGQLEFQYRQGDFNLHSSSMDWLVIVNSNWAKFKGTATIKDYEGIYPFRVDARDGDYGGGIEPDRFIIKIYAPGVDPDNEDPIYKASGDLIGGSIVIHAKK
jgi:probable HAF family extracellular repeat protein